jgi:uncharacterized protein (DUF488 family)
LKWSRYDAVMTTLWTIGYQGKALPNLVGELLEAEIEMLVDVRIRPASRKPGFSRKALTAELPHADIAYEHCRELGTPLDIRGIFRAGTKHLDEARAKYREYLLSEAADQLAWLAGVARKQRTAILCFELDPRECHRRVIAEELTRLHGFTIVDL